MRVVSLPLAFAPAAHPGLIFRSRRVIDWSVACDDCTRGLSIVERMQAGLRRSSSVIIEPLTRLPFSEAINYVQTDACVMPDASLFSGVDWNVDDTIEFCEMLVSACELSNTGLLIEVRHLVEVQGYLSTKGTWSTDVLIGVDVRVGARMCDCFGITHYKEIDLEPCGSVADAAELLSKACDDVMSDSAVQGVMSIPDRPESALLDEWLGAVLVHEAVGHSLEADVVLSSGDALLRSLPGREWGRKLTVDANPGLQIEGCYSVDDEGTPAEAVALMRDGVVETWMQSQETGLMSGLTSNGHARSSVDGIMARPRVSCLVTAPGEVSASELADTHRVKLELSGCEGGASGDLVRIRPLKAVVMRDGLRIGRVPPPTIHATPIEIVSGVLGTADETVRVPSGLGGCGKSGSGFLDVGAIGPAIAIDGSLLKWESK